MEHAQQGVTSYTALLCSFHPVFGVTFIKRFRQRDTFERGIVLNPEKEYFSISMKSRLLFVLSLQASALFIAFFLFAVEAGIAPPVRMPLFLIPAFLSLPILGFFKKALTGKGSLIGKAEILFIKNREFKKFMDVGRIAGRGFRPYDGCGRIGEHFTMFSRYVAVLRLSALQIHSLEYPVGDMESNRPETVIMGIVNT